MNGITEQQLIDYFENAKKLITLTDQQVDAGLSVVLERISAMQINSSDTQFVSIQSRLNSLVEILSPMCGIRAACRVICIAAERSPARSIEKITSDNWNPFLNSLRSIISVLCGDFGASIVAEYGA